MKKKLNTSVALMAFGLTALSACSTAPGSPAATRAEYMNQGAFDHNKIEVVKRTEYLEVAIDPVASEITNKSRSDIRAFVQAYTAQGKGPLVLSLPTSSRNPQLAISAIAEAREIAYETGVAYDELNGATHASSEPMVLAFQYYEALKPDCGLASEYDFSDIRSNNDMRSLGCSVRTNLAAMIADPSDLLGVTAIGPADSLRRSNILEKFREGESTAAARGANESGAVSNAVN